MAPLRRSLWHVRKPLKFPVDDGHLLSCAKFAQAPDPARRVGGLDVPSQIVSHQGPPGSRVHSQDLLLSAVLKQTEVLDCEAVHFRDVAVGGQVGLRGWDLKKSGYVRASTWHLLFGSVRHSCRVVNEYGDDNEVRFDRHFWRGSVRLAGIGRRTRRLGENGRSGKTKQARPGQ